MIICSLIYISYTTNNLNVSQDTQHMTVWPIFYVTAWKIPYFQHGHFQGIWYYWQQYAIQHIYIYGARVVTLEWFWIILVIYPIYINIYVGLIYRKAYSEQYTNMCDVQQIYYACLVFIIYNICIWHCLECKMGFSQHCPLKGERWIRTQMPRRPHITRQTM